MSDPEIVREFLSFLEDSGKKLTEEDYCTTEEHGKCFRVGNELIGDPPFLDHFRDFRDFNRDRLQLVKPKAPKIPKDIRSISTNRSAYIGYLLYGNPDVDYLLLRCSCRALDLKSKSIYRAISFNGRYWQYQSRQVKRTPEGLVPSCVID